VNAGRRRFLAALGATGTSALAGCSSPGGSSGDGGGRTDDRAGTATLTAAPASPTPAGGTPGPATAYRYTSLTPDGNRVVGGTLDLGAADPVDLPLESDPRWVVARPEPDGPGADWVVVSATGEVSAFGVRRDGTRTLDVTPSKVDPARPPVLRSTGRATLLGAPSDASTLTHPLPLGGSGLLYVRPDGTVVRERDGGRTSVDVGALPDARPRLVDEGRVAVLGGATDRYGHDALGDGTEAGRVVVLDVTGPELRAVGDVRLEGSVIEGLAPLVAGNEPALHVTESDREGGARQVVYAADGSRLATGPPIGQGFRWRHQLCVAPFAPDGVAELAVVRTPHIGGTAEFYRCDGDGLRITATASGVSSHALGSRILDGAFAADVDGDGRPELVVPDDARTSLVVVERTVEGAETIMTVPVGGRVTSNLHAVGALTGLQVGVGRRGGLRVWA
jgi:hypothetical protein